MPFILLFDFDFDFDFDFKVERLKNKKRAPKEVVGPFSLNAGRPVLPERSFLNPISGDLSP